MIKKRYADGSAPIESDQLRPMIKRVAAQFNSRIGNTLGPGGRNYYTSEGITNDGASIAKEIRFEDEREDSLADAFEEVARRQDKDAGDATTTAITLATALTPLVLDDVMDIDLPIPGMKSVMDIKRQLEDELYIATSYLEEETNKDVTLEELTRVASTVMEGHSSSKLIAETVFEMGYNSNIVLEEGHNEEVSAVKVPGIHYPLSIETPAFFTNPTRREAVYENPYIIVANHVFEAYTDLAQFFQGALDPNTKTVSRPIVIIGKQFSIPFTAQIVSIMRQTQGKVRFLLLSAKSLKDEEFKDIAEFLNANYIDTHPKEGQAPQPILFSDHGTCQKVVAGPKQTSFTAGDGIEAGRVSIRVEDLKKLAETETNELARQELLRRAAGLQGGVATIYVDAKTAVDRYYLKKKVEDAVNSCKSALEHGTHAGGGLAYLAAAEKMPDTSYLKKLLPVINKRVIQNAGGSFTIDPQTVRDSAYANICALKNAVSVVSLLATLEGVIADADADLARDLTKMLGYE